MIWKLRIELKHCRIALTNERDLFIIEIKVMNGN